MTIRYLTYLTGIYFGVVGICVAEPSPEDVANTVSNLWVSENLNQLESYITNLYASSSNYVPAILASAFYDSVFLGNYSTPPTNTFESGLSLMVTQMMSSGSNLKQCWVKSETR